MQSITSSQYVYCLLVLFASKIASGVVVTDGALFNCGLNEQFSFCGTACVETCDYKPQTCQEQCNIGCFCIPGFVRQSSATGSTCISRSSCPVKPTEQPGTTTESEQSTTTEKPKESTTTTKAAQPTITAKPEEPTTTTKAAQPTTTARSEQPTTTTKAAQPATTAKPEQPTTTKNSEHKCCKNQEYSTCGTSCPRTCDDLSFPLPKPPKTCKQMCQTGCFCKEGYYRTGRKKCVAPEKCCTGENEHYTSCGTACPETCGHKSKMCTDQCVEGCFCISNDYVRKDNGTNSPCIKRSACPK